jgi:Tfp pilus assembly protein PilE
MKLRKGTSIIEAAISIALMGIILLWSITAYTNVSKQSKSSEDIEIASTLASKQIEYVKALNYTNLQSIINSSSVVPFSSPYNNFGYKYTNVSVQENSNFYLKTITVEVYKMSDTSTPIIKMDCNFLRNKSDGTNAGI